MKPVHIFTDSCSDLGKDIRDRLSIDYVKMCTVQDGKEMPADLNWPTQSPKELYDIMRGGKRILTTQVPQDEFTKCFTKALEAGEDIIYIGCALPLSSSVNTGTMAARQLKEKYPEAEIYCIDSVGASLGEGSLAVYAAELRDAGKSAAEIAAAVEEKKTYVNMFLTVNTLDMLKKAGRVKGSAAFFGNLLGVKPIIVSDKNGQNVPVKKIKGRKASLTELVNMAVEAAVDPAHQTVYIAHADCEEEALALRDVLVNEKGFADAYVNYMGPIIGASVGPGAIGIFVTGKKVEFAV